MSEEDGPLLPLAFDNPDAVEDETVEDIFVVGMGVIEVYDMFAEAGGDELAEMGYDQSQIDAFQEAFWTFEKFIDRHDLEAVAADVDAIDDDILAEIAETFPPVAHIFVEDFEVPVVTDADVVEHLDVEIHQYGG